MSGCDTASPASFISVPVSDVVSNISACSSSSSLPIYVPTCLTDSPLPTVIPCTNHSASNKMEILWHNRLEHIPFSRMKDISYIPCDFPPK